jgi:hypothetical protein
MKSFHTLPAMLSQPARAPRGLRVNTRRLPALLAGLALLGACAGAPQQASTTAAPPLPQDPLAAFAAQATPGAQARVTLADGQPATVRLARSYYAASGRECREVLVGTGTGQRAQVVCQDPAGGWAVARPLLRGGGAIRQ